MMKPQKTLVLALGIAVAACSTAQRADAPTPPVRTEASNADTDAEPAADAPTEAPPQNAIPAEPQAQASRTRTKEASSKDDAKAGEGQAYGDARGAEKAKREDPGAIRVAAPSVTTPTTGMGLGRAGGAMGQAPMGAPPPMAPLMKPSPKTPYPSQPVAELIAGDEESRRDGQPRTNTGGTFVTKGTNPMIDAREDRFSTFAVDVDTGSYTFARRFMQTGQRPPAASVRVEEWVNAFHYEYAGPSNDAPFAVHMEAGPSPFAGDRVLLKVALQGKQVTRAQRQPVNVTFLVDVSGSMQAEDKLPMAKKSMRLLVDQLDERDNVSIATYAGSNALVLPATNATNKARIHDAIERLSSGGGTNMGSGMELAYREAGKHVGAGVVSRVIVLSDGDANIGRTSYEGILQSVRGYVSEGVTLSTVGFGTGNYNDNLMEQLADAGNGNYAYIDSMKAAKKTFVDDLTGTLQIIAKDVKVQVEFDPAIVEAYRLVGYENRDVADRDFRNDKVDAGEIGAGHTVTALYEVALKKGAATDGALCTVHLRSKQPRAEKATETNVVFAASRIAPKFSDLTADTRFATALGIASEILRGSPYAQHLSLEDARAMASEAADGKYAAERQDFVNLLGGAASVATR